MKGVPKSDAIVLYQITWASDAVRARSNGRYPYSITRFDRGYILCRFDHQSRRKNQRW